MNTAEALREENARLHGILARVLEVEVARGEDDVMLAEALGDYCPPSTPSPEEEPRNLRDAVRRMAVDLDRSAAELGPDKEENESWEDEANDWLRDTYEESARRLRILLDRFPEEAPPTLGVLAAALWAERREEDPEALVAGTTALAADGSMLHVLIGRTCGRDFMAGTICSRFVDDDGEHGGPCA